MVRPFDMSLELLRLPRPQCRMKMVRVSGEHGSFSLTHVEHVAQRFAPHFFTAYVVGVVESGKCCVMTPRGSWVAGPGSILAFSPNELHWAQVLSDEPYAYRTAYFSVESVRALRLGEAGAGGEVPRDLSPVLAPSELSRAFLDAHRDVSGNPGGVEPTARLLDCARSVFGAADGPPQRVCATRDLTLVESAKDLLRSHIGRHICLQHVADSCSVTEFHLIRVFRRVTGLSPYSYLIVMRVNEARRLLDAGASVSDAVHACCFSDQSHLTRVFKRTLGMPPGLYLRSARSHLPSANRVLRRDLRGAQVPTGTSRRGR